MRAKCMIQPTNQRHSSFNAFSRVDVRVEVKIPGGVDAYIIDLRGERHPPTPNMWIEVYLSAILRSILYADDTNYKIAGYRKLDPIRSLEDEVRFLAAAEACSSKGGMHYIRAEDCRLISVAFSVAVGVRSGDSGCDKCI